ncbi:MAG: ankyrin repeat domain-containing protein [Planctomycetota bacterium]
MSVSDADRALLAAARSGDVAALEKALAEGADVEAVDAYGQSALAVAIKRRRDDAAVRLIEAGADVSTTDLNPYWAIGTGRASILRTMLDAGADPNFTPIGGPVLQLAATRGHADMVRMLLDAGADPNAGNMLGSALAGAIREGHEAAAVALLDAGADASVATGSLLVEATHRRMQAVVPALLAAGVDVDGRAQIADIDRGGVKAALKAAFMGEATQAGDPFGGAIQQDVYANAPALHVAVRLAEAQLVEALLNGGANPHLRDEAGQLAIDHAKAAGDETLVRRLKAAMEAVAADEAPGEALALAIERGDLQEARRLLADGADPNARDPRERSRGATPLLLAIEHDRTDLLDALLDAGADPSLSDIGDDEQRAGLERSVSMFDMEGLDAMGSPTGRFPLGEAAARGDADLVDKLLAAGASVEAADVAGQTALILAAQSGQTETLRRLIDAGADVNRADRGKQTPLYHAAGEGRSSDCVLALLDAKAKLTARKACNPLIAAARAGLTPAVAAMLDRKAKLDKHDEMGITALAAAADEGHLDTLRLLLERGADVNGRCEDGETPIIQACWSVQGRSQEGKPSELAREVVAALCDAGADVNAKCDSGTTALANAVFNGDEPLIELLLDRGAVAGGTRLFRDESLVDVAKGHDHLSERLIHRLAATATELDPDEDDEDEDDFDNEELLAELGIEPDPADNQPPDLAAAADSDAFRDAVADLERRCGTKAQTDAHASGLVTLHVDSRADFDFDAARAETTTRGFSLVRLGIHNDQVGVLPTADKYEVMRVFQVNGANYGLGPAEVVAWLRQLEQETPFELIAVAHDTIDGRFLGPIPDPHDLAERMYRFCPDIADQGSGDLEALAEQLGESGRLFFWWD